MERLSIYSSCEFGNGSADFEISLVKRKGGILHVCVFCFVLFFVLFFLFFVSFTHVRPFYSPFSRSVGLFMQD